MKKISFLAFIFMFLALLSNAAVNWEKVNKGCYSMDEYRLPKEVQIKMTLTPREYEKFQRAVKNKDPMTDGTLITYDIKDFLPADVKKNIITKKKHTIVFKDLNAFVGAEYLSKEKRTAYLKQHFLPTKVTDGGVNFCEREFSAALRARLQGVIEYCINIKAIRFDDLIDFGISNTWQTWAMQFACSGNLAANKYMLAKKPKLINHSTDDTSFRETHYYIFEAVGSKTPDKGFHKFVINKCKADKECNALFEETLKESKFFRHRVNNILSAQETDVKEELVNDIKNYDMALIPSAGEQLELTSAADGANRI